MTAERIDIQGKRILISGAAGFIGSNLCRTFVKRGAGVYALVRPKGNLWRIEDVLPELNLCRCDLTDPVSVTQTVREIEPEIIIHCAARGITDRSLSDESVLSNNIKMTQNILEAARGIDYLGFVHLGSSTEYGPRDIPLTEEMVLRPSTVFGVSKSAASLLCQREACVEGKPVVILRLFSVYGYWESGHRLIPHTILAVLRNRELSLTRRGIRRDFVFIEDVVGSVLKVFKKNIWGGEIINIGSGIQYSNEEIVEKIFSISQKEVPISSEIFPPRSHDTSFWVADIQKALDLLDWQPGCAIDEGIRKTVQWFRNHHQEY